MNEKSTQVPYSVLPSYVKGPLSYESILKGYGIFYSKYT